jgi:hypothetical protein
LFFFRPGVATGAGTKARQTLRVARLPWGPPLRCEKPTICRSFSERETMVLHFFGMFTLG